jgi:putative endonuclease
MTILQRMGNKKQRNEYPTKPADSSAATLGQRGEALASRWLAARGYRILAQNWRFGRLELDVVAQQDSTLVIVEVKTRRESSMDPPGRPEEAVGLLKQRKLAQAGRAFLRARPDCQSLRFDVIAIRVRGNRCRLFHQQDAFFPEG